MAEFTILDAPETPAPVFAFRALKGAIFGSPNDEEHNSKENASPQKSNHSLRSKISALRAISVSPPKRRKSNLYASPAKSILRTPGIPTPRRPNTSVTFKDVTPSISLETTRKNSPTIDPAPRHAIPVTLPAAVQTTSKALQDLPLTAPRLNDTTQDSETTDQDQKNSVVSFDFEAYRLSTEKEMKKLVRYGQKMREYARKQDEENTKLRIALEKLQKENEELRHREGPCDSGRVETECGRQVEQEAGRQILPARPASISNAQTVSALTASTTGRSLSKSNMKAQAQARLSPLKRKASTQLRPEQSQTPISQHHAHSNAQAGPSIGKDAPTGRPVGARLPLERLAAARERIRLKAERRRGTAVTASSPVNWNAL